MGSTPHYPTIWSDSMRTCETCRFPKADEAFEETRTGHRRRTCQSCRRAAKYAKVKADPVRWAAYAAKSKAWSAAKRRNVAWAIWRDARGSDRKAGRANDLTVEFIRQQIENPCGYCGEAALRMTLDRVDNSIGHVMTNVVACCVRCNYVRRDMPHPAWQVVARAMATARSSGLFQTWTCEVHKGRSLTAAVSDAG